jgi:hypothetical protein
VPRSRGRREGVAYGDEGLRDADSGELQGKSSEAIFPKSTPLITHNHAAPVNSIL